MDGLFMSVNDQVRFLVIEDFSLESFRELKQL